MAVQITFLGTGAADFTATQNTTDRFRIDENVRRSTATLLDGELLFDAGLYLLDSLQLFCSDAVGIRNVLLTHGHIDHYCPEQLSGLASLTGREIHVYYSGGFAITPLDGVVYHILEAGQTYDVGGYAVTPLFANHSPGAFHYSLEKDGKRLFYGPDGGWFLAETFAFMKEKRYDVLILDATVGEGSVDGRLAVHNSVPMIRLMIPAFAAAGVTNSGSRIVLDHLGRTLHPTHREICSLVEGDGFTVAYDGMTLSL